MRFLFNVVNSAFYAEYMLLDGSYGDIDVTEFIEPTPAEMTKYHKTTPPAGQQLGTVDDRPAWVDLPPPSHEQLVSLAEQQKSQMRKTADSEIVWLQDAVDAGSATEEETVALTEWKNYRVLLMRVDILKPVWPTPPVEQAS